MSRLNYRKSGSGKPLIILHGLFGSLDNWASLGKRFSEDYEVYLVDQRNHGRSFHDPVHSYDVMSEDIALLIEELKIDPVAVIGHSMGGKTVLRLAQRFPHLLSSVISVDMGIKEYPPHHEQIIAGLHALDIENLDSRKTADEELTEWIPETGVRQFLLKNLYRNPEGGYLWRFNLEALEEQMPEILSPLPSEDADIPTLFLYGGASDYILEEDKASISQLFHAAEFKELPDVGHWVHAEAPELFYTSCMEFLERTMS